jgi:hypothetical protein
MKRLLDDMTVTVQCSLNGSGRRTKDSLAAQLKLMGAEVCSRFNKSVTHIVWIKSSEALEEDRTRLQALFEKVDKVWLHCQLQRVQVHCLGPLFRSLQATPPPFIVSPLWVQCCIQDNSIAKVCLQAASFGG